MGKLGKEERPFRLLNESVTLLQENLIIADTGKTYLLADLAHLSNQEATIINDLEEIFFITLNTIFRNYALEQLISLVDGLTLQKLQHLKDLNNPKFAGRSSETKKNKTALTSIC